MPRWEYVELGNVSERLDVVNGHGQSGWRVIACYKARNGDDRFLMEREVPDDPPKHDDPGAIDGVLRKSIGLPEELQDDR